MKRYLYRLETAKMRRFEENAWRSSQLCLTVSGDERREIVAAGVAPEKVIVVPNGVDLERFEFKPRPRQNKLLFLAGLDYLPNRDAAQWLLDEIWPRISEAEPAAVLLLAGRGTKELAAEGLPEGVVCLGDPADVPGCFAMADALLVPLRIGAGTRLKILEAMASGLPVVSTVIGYEGTEAVAAVHLLTGDTPQAFAAACLQLLAEPRRAADIACRARKLVEERYSWELQGEHLANLYSELSAGANPL